MNALEKLIDICKSYKSGKYTLPEFQSQIEMVLLPDNFKYSLEVDQHNAVNRLEKIYYFYSESEHKQHADKVADELIAAAQAELDK